MDLKRDDALVYLHGVYSGPGLNNVPRGTITHLRILAYHFGYRHLAGLDKVGYGGPWEVMRILGTVPVEKDGSTFFRVPANTPLAVQTLDSEGKAVQLMRSWFTAMPGEKVSCVGCHESPGESVPSQLVRAAQMQPREIDPWYGPARGFDFAREVQPVLDRYCVTCHDGEHPGRPDLRPEHLVKNYRGKKLSGLGVNRLHPKMKKETKGILKYTPAYEALIPYIRRVNVEDDVSLLTPGEYHADTSDLIQMLRKGHQGVQLDAESMDRQVTWIDLNGPCHGSWVKVHPYPTDSCERRKEMLQQYGGPTKDLERILHVSKTKVKPSKSKSAPKPKFFRADGWPFEAQMAQ